MPTALKHGPQLSLLSRQGCIYFGLISFNLAWAVQIAVPCYLWLWVLLGVIFKYRAPFFFFFPLLIWDHQDLLALFSLRWKVSCREGVPGDFTEDLDLEMDACAGRVTPLPPEPRHYFHTHFLDRRIQRCVPIYWPCFSFLYVSCYLRVFNWVFSHSWFVRNP